MKTIKKTMKGYKVFNPDFTCNGYKFSEDSEHKHEGMFKICESGFHFCLKLGDCFSYYSFNKNNIVCEVEALGDVQTHIDDSKACTNHIKIGRILSWDEVLFNANDGVDNTGHSNSGDSNSGNRNSGDSNSGYRNSGAFCTDINPKAILFNKESNLTIKEWEAHPAYNVMCNYLNFTFWIESSEMSDEEKLNNPKHETVGGYLKKISHKDGWANMWGNLSEENKKHFKSIPNYDSEIFEEITGIKY